VPVTGEKGYVVPEIWEIVQPPEGMPVKQTWLLLLIWKFPTQIGWLVHPAVCFPFFAAVDTGLLSFFLARGFVFFDLLTAPFLTFFIVPVAVLLAAFFGVPLAFFFFFFKIVLLSNSHRAARASMHTLAFSGAHFPQEVQGT
jgi:hypothetical protein